MVPIVPLVCYAKTVSAVGNLHIGESVRSTSEGTSSASIKSQEFTASIIGGMRRGRTTDQTMQAVATEKGAGGEPALVRSANPKDLMQRVGSVGRPDGVARHAADHSTTRSALLSNSEGMVIPIAMAVFKFTTSSRRVITSMGSSPALAPFRILSTYTGTRGSV
jgi:hypothetical protein